MVLQNKEIWARSEGAPKRFLMVPSADGSFRIVDPSLSATEIPYEQAVELGIFAFDDPQNADHAFLRCEFLFEVWREQKSKDSRLVKHGEVDQATLDAMVGENAYYKSAVWWATDFPTFLGLYDWIDLERPITWSEVGYLLYFVFKAPPEFDWKRINHTQQVSILTEVRNGRKTMVMKLGQYKSSPYFTEYLEEIRKGARYLPFPLACSFEEFRHQYPEFGLKDGDLFKEVTRAEAKTLLARMA